MVNPNNNDPPQKKESEIYVTDSRLPPTQPRPLFQQITGHLERKRIGACVLEGGEEEEEDEGGQD
jgi:hypothetical protein